MRIHPTRNRVAAFVLLATAVVHACDTPSDPQSHVHDVAASLSATRRLPRLGGSFQEVKRSTTRFHSTNQANRAGYHGEGPCVAAPGLGGMGFHWVNEALVDPVFEAGSPEAVLYEATESGQLKLLAVEYIVVNVGQPAPTFDGHPFDVGGTPVPVPHWSLHVWLYKENPNGIFTPFNPDVSCD